MKKIKIKKGDKIKITCGEHKGSEGKVVKILKEKNKLVVEGINIVKKHLKPNSQNPKGGIKEVESPIHISNVILLTPNGEPTKVGFKLEDGKKVRYAKKNRWNFINMNYLPRLKKEFKEKVIPSLKTKHKYKNVMQVPRLTKIVLSRGVGAAVSDKKLIDYSIDELTKISGQKAVQTLSKKDVSSFKLRKGMPIGAKVTLRGDKMYEFFDRLVTASLPRVRDFQGVKVKGFDGRGNYNLGITEQIIFPEIDIDKVNKISGMDITFVTSAKTDDEAKSLLSELGLPFKK